MGAGVAGVLLVAGVLAGGLGLAAGAARLGDPRFFRRLKGRPASEVAEALELGGVSGPWQGLATRYLYVEQECLRWPRDLVRGAVLVGLREAGCRALPVGEDPWTNCFEIRSVLDSGWYGAVRISSVPGGSLVRLSLRSRLGAPAPTWGRRLRACRIAAIILGPLRGTVPTGGRRGRMSPAPAAVSHFGCVARAVAVPAGRAATVWCVRMWGNFGRTTLGFRQAARADPPDRREVLIGDLTGADLGVRLGLGDLDHHSAHGALDKILVSHHDRISFVAVAERPGCPAAGACTSVVRPKFAYIRSRLHPESRRCSSVAYLQVCALLAPCASGAPAPSMCTANSDAPH